jgi:hypothetical protein
MSKRNPWGAEPGTLPSRKAKPEVGVPQAGIPAPVVVAPKKNKPKPPLRKPKKRYSLPG